jgi:UDP-N-acetylmuramate--alanine ligase
MRWKVNHVHMIGIGGIGMSGIAEVMINLGYKITGSDLKETELTKRLEQMGAIINYKHHKNNLKGADVVVMSSAVRETNPEIAAAKQLGLPIIPRAEMLAELMRMKNGIAIAGSHGKTTTASMVSTVLHQAGWDPTAVIGGRLNAFGSNARLGTGEWMVVEADESDGSFIKLKPMMTVVTNIDREHMDHYRNKSNLEKAFLEFINSVPFYGLSVLCADCPLIRKIMPRIKRPHITYGESERADIRAIKIKSHSPGCTFTVMKKEHELGTITLGIPGRHNAINALAAVALAMELEIQFPAVARALQGFKGIQRRFEVRGSRNGIIIVDDYAHHPTEIQATLQAAREWRDKRLPQDKPQRLICLFQPHRYSRTQDLEKQFTRAFNQAEILILTEIYSAGEDPIPGVTGERLYKAVKRMRNNQRLKTEFVPDLKDIPGRIGPLLKEGDLVLTMGAGNIWQAGDQLIKILGG